ncbi:hypothetical protein TRVA0_008S02894 [Trichomonascus vanleenenianus]|uniref:uncharacterized protein n=1 Tax=Trichomonascus vanleenenianus TaxID=2268995 RepID=UPI003ECB3C34
MIRAEDAVGYPSSSQEDVNEYGSTSDGYRYKPEGLIKQSFSITTSTNVKLHLISYFARQDLDRLMAPTEDPRLKHVKIPEGLYPESASAQDSRVSSVSPHPMGAPRSDSYPYGPSYYNPGPSPPQQHQQQQQQLQHHQQQPLQHHQQHQRHPVYGPGPVHHHAPPPPPPPPSHRPGSYQLPPPHRSQPIPRPTQIQAQHYPSQLHARDIPYDRVAFGEDQRAIQVLDKRFAL